MDSISSVRFKFSGDLMTNIISAQSSPFFLATLTSSVPNVTGDGTSYTCLFDTVSSGSGYNTSTGNFTCVIPGDYFFIARIYVTGVTSSHTTCKLTFITNTSSYLAGDFNLATGMDASNAMMFPEAVLPLRMAIGDTINVSIQTSNGNKVVTFDTLSQFQGVRLI